jgi:hypothetical protein
MHGLRHLLIALVLTGCVAGEKPQAAVERQRVAAEKRRIAAVDDTYPADITPPPGTQSPCALTALPKDLAGIPADERSYINRTYTRILRATQAKLVVLKALHEKSDARTEASRYDDTIENIVNTLKADVAPDGLRVFHSEVITAIELQRSFFSRATADRRAGASMEQIYQLPQGREASAKLMSAWGQMSARYPSWSAATKDSIYHHLCALDLF